MILTVYAKEKIVNPYDMKALVKEKEKPVMSLRPEFDISIDINLHKTNYKLNDTEEFSIWRASKGE